MGRGEWSVEYSTARRKGPSEGQQAVSVSSQKHRTTSEAREEAQSATTIAGISDGRGVEANIDLHSLLQRGNGPDVCAQVRKKTHLAH